MVIFAIWAKKTPPYFALFLTLVCSPSDEYWVARTPLDDIRTATTNMFIGRIHSFLIQLFSIVWFQYRSTPIEDCDYTGNFETSSFLPLNWIEILWKNSKSIFEFWILSLLLSFTLKSSSQPFRTWLHVFIKLFIFEIFNH